MSELKAYTFSAMERIGLADYYLKSEADKVIARHKHKRCLAIADGCQDKIKYWHIRYTTAAGYDRSYEKWKHRLFIKWRKRWLAIAEKFKPNSTAL